MSVVAVRDGMMAADSQVNINSMPVHYPKLHRQSGSLIGCVGQMVTAYDFLEWFAAGADRSKIPDFRQYRGNEDAPSFTALVLTTEGVVEWDEYFVPFKIYDSFYAVGSGAPAAKAAMHMGAGAKEAVEVACKVFIDCGGEIMVERL